MQSPQAGLVYSRKKLLQIPMNNEKMHNVLRIYMATFTGHKHLQLYLGRVETQGAAGRRRRRCQVWIWSEQRRSSSSSLCRGEEGPLVLHHGVPAQTHSKQSGWAAQTRNHAARPVSATADHFCGGSRISPIALFPSAEETRCTYSGRTCRPVKLKVVCNPFLGCTLVL